MSDKFVEFYKKHDLPLAQTLVLEDKKNFISGLKSLIKILNPEITDSIEQETYAQILASNEDFLVFYYYHKFCTPGMSLLHFRNHMKRGSSQGLSNSTRKIFELLYPQNDLMLLNHRTNVLDTNYERLLCSLWEILTIAVFKDKVNTELAIKQFMIIDKYYITQSNIRASDYNEAELEELNFLMAMYSRDEISLDDLVNTLPNLNISTNVRSKEFIEYINRLNTFVYIDPSIVVHEEVTNLNRLLKKDRVYEDFFDGREISVENAEEFLDLFDLQVLGLEDVTPDALSLIFSELHYDIRAGLYSFDDEVIIKTYFQVLSDAATKMENLPGILEFLKILESNKLESAFNLEYDIELMKSGELTESVKAACVYILIFKAQVKLVNTFRDSVEDYKPLMKSMRNLLDDILEILSNIEDETIRLRSAIRITHLLYQIEIHGELLKDFLNNNAKELIGQNGAMFIRSMSPSMKQNYSIKKFISKIFDES